MELELIYSKMAYEKARYKMVQKSLDCQRIEEEINHFKILSDLQHEKEHLLKQRTEQQNNYFYKPIIVY